MKKGFENDERLSSKAKPSVNAGKSNQVPDYVRRKVQARKRYDEENAGQEKKGFPHLGFNSDWRAHSSLV